MSYYRATCKVTLAAQSEWVRAGNPVQAEHRIRAQVQRNLAEALGVDPGLLVVSVGRLVTHEEEEEREQHRP